MKNNLTTYRRADGEPIWGEYDFVVNEEFLEEVDEPLDVIKEVWQLSSSEVITFRPTWEADNEE